MFCDSLTTVTWAENHPCQTSSEQITKGLWPGLPSQDRHPPYYGRTGTAREPGTAAMSATLHLCDKAVYQCGGLDRSWTLPPGTCTAVQHCSSQTSRKPQLSKSCRNFNHSRSTLRISAHAFAVSWLQLEMASPDRLMGRAWIPEEPLRGARREMSEGAKR